MQNLKIVNRGNEPIAVALDGQLNLIQIAEFVTGEKINVDEWHERNTFNGLTAEQLYNKYDLSIWKWNVVANCFMQIK